MDGSIPVYATRLELADDFSPDGNEQTKSRRDTHATQGIMATGVGVLCLQGSVHVVIESGEAGLQAPWVSVEEDNVVERQQRLQHGTTQRMSATSSCNNPPAWSPCSASRSPRSLPSSRLPSSMPSPYLWKGLGKAARAEFNSTESPRPEENQSWKRWRRRRNGS